MACSLSGITWSFRSSHCFVVPTFFMRPLGIVQIFLSRSISAHLEPAASLGLTIVCNCHSIKSRVGIAMLVSVIAAINTGRSLFSKDGLCTVLGVLNLSLI